MDTMFDALFKRADMRCTICNARAGACDCWTKCKCGWSHEKDAKCRNPKCGGDGCLSMTHTAPLTGKDA